MSPCPILLLSKVSTLQVSWGESTEGGADGQRMDGTKNCVGTAMCQKKWFLAKDWLLFVFLFFYLCACVSVQIFWCLFKNIQLAGNLSQLVKEGSQMCRQHNQGLPKEKLASDANQHATGRARVPQLHWHADLLDLLFVAWTVTCVKGNCWPCCGAMSVKVLWNRLTELGLCCVRHFWSWIIQTVL